MVDPSAAASFQLVAKHQASFQLAKYTKSPKIRARAPYFSVAGFQELSRSYRADYQKTSPLFSQIPTFSHRHRLG